MWPRYIIASLLTDIITHLLHNTSKNLPIPPTNCRKPNSTCWFSPGRNLRYVPRAFAASPRDQYSFSFYCRKGPGKSCFVYFAVSWLYFAVSLLVSWLYFAVSWFLLCRDFCRELIVFCCEFITFCHELIVFCRELICILLWVDFYFAVSWLYFAVSWFYFAVS